MLAQKSGLNYNLGSLGNQNTDADDEVIRMNNNFCKLVLLAAISSVFTGCTAYINIPEEKGSIASSNPNSGTVNKVVVSAMNALMTQQGTTEQPVELILPDGVNGKAAWAIQDKLGKYVFCRKAEKIVLKRAEDVNPELDYVLIDEQEMPEEAAEISEVEGEGHDETSAHAEGGESEHADHDDDSIVVKAEESEVEVVSNEEAEAMLDEELAMVEVEAAEEVMKPEFVRVLLTQVDAPDAEYQYDVKGIRVRGVKAEVDVYKMTHFTLDQFYSIKLNYEAFVGWRVKRIDSLGVLRDKVLDGEALPVQEAP
ncbi:hypothetical protein JD969_18920 [Planctomycetota bacterium]|nr:hypothetical protein JD969_18920 [Planctomycetota bacterium]